MKKIIGIIPLSIIGILSLNSCGKNESTSSVTSAPVATTTSSAVVTTTSSALETTTSNATVTTTTAAPTTTTTESTTSSNEGVTYTGYYQGLSNVTFSDANALKSKLNQIISADYKKISYGDCTNALKTIDSYDGNYVECLYSGVRLDPANSGSSAGQWNKEHTWAKSHGFNAQTYDAYSDLHHLRVTEVSANSARENSYFDTVTNGTTSEYGYKYTSDTFEPRDSVKGDVARMLLYMVCRYDDESNVDLELTDTISLINDTHNGGLSYLGKLSTLIKWNYDDPVDSREISRNEAIYNVQKNRNPFIDHPELVYYLYKNESEALGVTEDNVESKVLNFTLKDDSAIGRVNNVIEQIGNVTLDSKDKIDTAQAAYDALDDESKSFVTKYNVLQEAINTYNALNSQANQDTTISTTFDIAANIAAASGTFIKNGITIDFEGSMFNASKGLYAQAAKGISITAKDVYSTVKAVSIKFNCNTKAASQVVKVTISDGNNKVEKDLTLSTTITSEELNVSSLDISKNLTITISGPSVGSFILGEISFNI